MTDTVFQKIIDKEIPTDIIYEDEICIAIHDLHPQAPIHILIIPKKSITKVSEANDEDKALLGHLMLVGNKLARQQNIDDGFRFIINNGAKAGQSVFHLHVHLLGGRIMNWPPG